MNQNELEARIKLCLEQVPEKFESRADQLIPLLQFMQGELGYIPPEGIRGIAEFLKIPPGMVYGVATFYAQFRFKPIGRNHITVCRGTACHVRGSARILQDTERYLKIKPGETSEDMMFSLETVACLGSCALAPVTVINRKVHGKVTSKKIGQTIDLLKKAGPVREKKPAKKAVKKKTAAKAAIKKAAKKKNGR